MPVDPYWERIHLAFSFEIEKRAFYHGKKNNEIFLPGEIVYVRGFVALRLSWFEYLEWLGYTLLKQEVQARHWATRISKAKQNEGGKFCVVIERLGSGRYVVCYLATFGRRYHQPKTPVGEFFGLAMAPMSEWPIGVPPLRTHPVWPVGAFVLGLPVVRRDLKRPTRTTTRYVLRDGELDRLKQFIMDREKAFKSAHMTIRRSQLNSWSNFFIGDEPDYIPVRTPPPLTEAVQGQIPPAEANPIRFKTPRIHWLEPPLYNHNVRWLLRYLHRDIFYASTYLDSLVPPRPVFKSLPEPYRKPRVHLSTSIIKRLPIH